LEIISRLTGKEAFDLLVSILKEEELV